MRREVGKLMQMVELLLQDMTPGTGTSTAFRKNLIEILGVDGRIPSKEIIADIAVACVEMKMIPDTQEETKHAEEKRILTEDPNASKSRIDSIVPGLTKGDRKELEGRFMNLSTQVMRGISAEANSRN